MIPASKLGDGDASHPASQFGSKRQRLNNTHVTFFAVPPDMADALHLLRNICSSCIGAHVVQLNELGIYNAFGLINIVCEHLQAAPRTESYLGEYVLIKEIDVWDCPHSVALDALCAAIVAYCPLSQIERILKLMLRCSSTLPGDGRARQGSARALHQAFSAACSIIPYQTFSAIVKSPDFGQIRSRIIGDHDHALLQAVRLRSQRHRRSNCALRAVAALSSGKVSSHMGSFHFGTTGISSVLRGIIGRRPFVSSQPVDPFGVLPCSGCLDLSTPADAASHYPHCMLFCTWRMVRKCCALLWNSFDADSLSTLDLCARSPGYHALNLLGDALVALVSAAEDDRPLHQLIQEMEQHAAAVSPASRLVLVSLSAQLLHQHKKRLSHRCLQLLLSLNPASPFSPAPACGHLAIDRAVTYVTNHMNKVGSSLRGSDVDAVAAAADWTSDPAAVSLIVDASFLPAISELGPDLPIYHIFDTHLRNAPPAVLSRLPIGAFWRFAPVAISPTLFTSLSLQFRSVLLHRHSLIGHLAQSKTPSRQSDLLKTESVVRLAEIVVLLLRSMPAGSSLLLHRLAVELGNPSLAAPVVRYFDVFSFRLLPLVLRSNCAVALLKHAAARMKVVLGNIQSQQFPLHFRVLNDFVVAMAQNMSESYELPDDIWEMLPETSCRIIIRCMNLASECARSSDAPQIICSATSHLRRLSAQTRMRDWNVTCWGRASAQLCEPFRSAFRADRKAAGDDWNSIASAEDELMKAFDNGLLTTPQRVIHWLREKKHSVLKLKTLFACFWDMIARQPGPPSLLFFENELWRSSLITWVQSLSPAAECSQASFSLVSYIASKTPCSPRPQPDAPSPTARALDYFVWGCSFAPFHDVIVAISECDHENSIDWLLHLLRPDCCLERACSAYSDVIFADSKPVSAFDRCSVFTRRGAPDMWMLPRHCAALDAAEACMPAHTPIAEFTNISASYRLFYSWPACALPAITHVIVVLIQRELWRECADVCRRFRYLFLCCSLPMATSRRLLAAALNRGAPFETCLAILGLAWGIAPSLPADAPSMLARAERGDVSSLVCFAVDCVQPLLQHSRDDDSLIAAAFGDAEHLCMMREHLDPRACGAAVGCMAFLLACSANALAWQRLLLSESVDATSVGFLIASLPASCAAAAVGAMLGPGQALSDSAIHVCTALMAPTMSLILAQRIVTLAAVQLHCAASTGSSCRVLLSTRIAASTPPDLHSEAAVSELLWSFFASLVDGCSRWQLPDGASSAAAGAVSSHEDVGGAPDAAPNAIASQRFGQAFEGQFNCSPSQCNASHVQRVSQALALFPDLGLAYDLFCSVIFDARKIRTYSAALFASISDAARIFFQLFAAELKPDA